MPMTSIAWLCMAGLAALVAETAYIISVGHVAAGPFKYRRNESPIAFYTIVFVTLALGVIAIVYIWARYGSL